MSRIRFCRAASAALFLGALSPLAAQGQRPVDLAAFAPQVDTFVLEVGGRAIGNQVITVTSVDGGFLFQETTTTSAGSQSTEVRTDGMLGLRAGRQQGVMGGQVMRIEVDYGGGRATGHARVPGPAGMMAVVVDAAVPADVIDDNILLAMLPAIRWEDGMSFDLPVFASGRNSLVNHSVTARLEELALPAGTVPTYRVEIEGGDVPLLVHLTEERPHRVLRLEPVGSPMLVVRGPVSPAPD